MFDAALSDLIGGIYDAAIDPTRWHDAVDAIRRRYDFQIAMLVIINIPDELVVQVACNVPPTFVERMGDYVVDALDLWGGPATMSRLPLEEPLLNSLQPRYATLATNRYYLEWGKPQGLIDQVVMLLANDRTMNASIGLGLRADRAPLTDREMQELRVLAPHLKRAATISNLLEVRANAATTFRSAFDAMRSGAILVGPNLEIVYANAAADEMLRAGDPIRSLRGRLELTQEIVAGQLQTAVTIAAQSEADLGRRGLGIHARRRDESAVAAYVMPLKQRSARAATPKTAVAAVFISDASGPAASPSEAARVLYGLSPAEGRVFELVAAGQSSPQIAADLGIAASTLKTHLLHVFDKTGRRNRAPASQAKSAFRSSQPLSVLRMMSDGCASGCTCS